MKKTEPAPPLLPSKALYKAARDLVIDTGRTWTKTIGHIGSDGSSPWDRIERYGEWEGNVAENISYGHQDPLNIVIQLLIDENAPDRGHRKNILNPRHRFVGAGIGAHRRYRHMCVITFASEILEKAD